jgi:hypothetical protein
MDMIWAIALTTFKKLSKLNLYKKIARDINREL